jgi:hypothetical protein
LRKPRRNRDGVSVTYKRGVDLCLRKHPEIFYKILVYGKGRKRSGPPCDECRHEAIRENKRLIKKETMPWLRKEKRKNAETLLT